MRARVADCTVFGYFDSSVAERTGAAASVERRRREPDRAISPELQLKRGSASPVSARTLCLRTSAPPRQLGMGLGSPTQTPRLYFISCATGV